MRITILAGFLLVIIQGAWAVEKTVVLQNGLDGYNGCIDTYITTISGLVEYDQDPKKTNKSADVELFLRNCPK